MYRHTFCTGTLAFPLFTVTVSDSTSSKPYKPCIDTNNAEYRYNNATTENKMCPGHSLQHTAKLTHCSAT